jgi:hypothetical protein
LDCKKIVQDEAQLILCQNQCVTLSVEKLPKYLGYVVTSGI